MTTPHDRFTTYAGSWTLATAGEGAGERVTEVLCALFANLLAGLAEAGSPLIGHIKVLASAGEAGHVVLSVTRYDEPLRPRGGFRTDFREVTLTLNVIVLGATQEALARIVAKALPQDLFRGLQLTPATEPAGVMTRAGFRSARDEN